jgi:hypothetical protein
MSKVRDGWPQCQKRAGVPGAPQPVLEVPGATWMEGLTPTGATAAGPVNQDIELEKDSKDAT